ncbi:hypothetical protein SFRURICE_014101, partial [Spodoptera frugiperda]
KQRPKPSQEAMKNKIALLEKNLNALYSARDTMSIRAEVDKQIIKLREEIKTAKQSLNRKVQNAVAQKKHRDEKKRQAALHKEAAWDGSLANQSVDTFHPRWLHDRALKEHVRFTKVYVIDIIIIDIFLCEILDCTAPKRFWSFK